MADLIVLVGGSREPGHEAVGLLLVVDFGMVECYTVDGLVVLAGCKKMGVVSKSLSANKVGRPLRRVDGGVAARLVALGSDILGKCKGHFAALEKGWRYSKSGNAWCGIDPRCDSTGYNTYNGFYLTAGKLVGATVGTPEMVATRLVFLCGVLF